MARYGTVWLVRRTEEDKYGTDIWVVLLLPTRYYNWEQKKTAQT
jgi:hypothetical protein